MWWDNFEEKEEMWMDVSFHGRKVYRPLGLRGGTTWHGHGHGHGNWLAREGHGMVGWMADH